MHKAITIMQFKLEGEIIRRRPEFGMDDRLLLHHIDLRRGTIRIEGKEYELKTRTGRLSMPRTPMPFRSKKKTDAAHQALVRM